MLIFQWNALRKGDSVVMHDGAEASDDLFPGVVTAVSMRMGSNGVGIRVATPDGGREIVWPSPLVVHRSAKEDGCWRCRHGAATRS